MTDLPTPRIADPTQPPSNGIAGAIVRGVIVLALLYLFLVAIKLMGTSFKLVGADFAKSLVAATNNPLAALFIGILATALIQSSSVTTSLIVGLVSVPDSGLTLEAAVPMIMGANIGTSVTNTIVSLGHMGNRAEFRRAFAGAVVHDVFNWMTVALLLPIELATGVLTKTARYLAAGLYGSTSVTYSSPIAGAVKPVAKAAARLCTDIIGLSATVAGVVLLVVSLLVIFACLTGLVKVLRAIMSDRLEGLVHRALSKGAIVTMGIGVAVTAAVQSSSITTSILVPLVATGLITLEHAFPITLGANVGTTVTALLASLAGNVNGLAIALVHVLFNVAGILILYPAPPLRRIPLSVARGLGALAARNRPAALGLILGAFFLLPLGIILLGRIAG